MMLCDVFSLLPGVYVWTLNLIASIPCPSFHTLMSQIRPRMCLYALLLFLCCHVGLSF